MKNILCILIPIMFFAACQKDDLSVPVAVETPIPTPVEEVEEPVAQLTLTGYSAYGTGHLNLTFSAVNATYIQFEFDGASDPAFVVEGSNDKVRWDILPIYNTTVGEALIRDAFIPVTGNSVYELRSVTSKFCRLKVVQMQSSINGSKSVKIYIKYSNHPKVIKFNGDSLTAGAGAGATGNASVPTLFQQDFPDYLVVSDAIGGQKSAQIFAREGGFPITLTVEGNMLNGDNIKNIASISVNFLSTAADTHNRLEGGTINGNPVMMFEQNDVYTLRAINAETIEVPAGSVFVPNAADNYRQAINIFWAGRNDSDYNNLVADYANALNTLSDPKRFIVIGILPQLNEITGTERFNRIIAFNDSLRAAYPDNYVETLPPTDEEMADTGYTPSSKDLSDIASGTFPEGMKADNTHLNSYGYRIIEKRLKTVFLAVGY